MAKEKKEISQPKKEEMVSIYDPSVNAFREVERQKPKKKNLSSK